MCVCRLLIDGACLLEGAQTDAGFGAVSHGRHLSLKAGPDPNEPADIDKASAGRNELLVTAVKTSH